MLKLGLIGKGISRSQSARLHVLLGRMCGIDVTYDYLDSEKIADFDLIGQLAACAKAGYAGVNVTHPYKTEARKLIQRRKRLPEALGAVNTVVFREDGWRGDNTDYVGFMRGYRGQFMIRHRVRCCRWGWRRRPCHGIRVARAWCGTHPYP